MVNFLLVFSIALNILALLCIALLFIRQNRLAAFESRQEKALEEMEEIVSTFIAEIKEENELFLQRIHELDEQPKKSLEEAVEEKEDKNEEPASFTVPKANPYAAAVKSYQTYDSNIKPDDVEELLDLILPQSEVLAEDDSIVEEIEQEPKEMSLLEQVIELEKQGETIEQIAKKLNKGKTEIELLLKFRQNNQE
ncbi:MULTISPECIES: hypothetical protein [unclassified Niallia]|uniref:hypothetical protein n=1 Tax=unclassified Niallia TaxID=2837522 RepID=UPI001EDB9306|nr:MULTISPECIES: hypothetical protein [unclassified Niallia]MDL0434194.1 hypothetical protein [Niallia sp. SS-2023]UPO88951.1 hypothetical protein L8T27_007250 [Niallia sp. Man26]